MTKFTVPEGVPDWIRDHTQEYLDSNGEKGHIWDRPDGSGTIPTLLLVTTGRRSGNDLTLPLIYGEDADSYIVIASKGGAPTHPLWFRNLEATPECELQIGAKQVSARARVAEGDERERIWAKMVEIYPPYTDYQKATERTIPVVVLDLVE